MPLIFSYIGLVVAAIGVGFGALLIIASINQAGVPAVSDELFRGGFPMFFGGLVMGVLCEISISLRRGKNG